MCKLCKNTIEHTLALARSLARQQTDKMIRTEKQRMWTTHQHNGFSVLFRVAWTTNVYIKMQNIVCRHRILWQNAHKWIGANLMESQSVCVFLAFCAWEICDAKEVKWQTENAFDGFQHKNSSRNCTFANEKLSFRRMTLCVAYLPRFHGPFGCSCSSSCLNRKWPSMDFNASIRQTKSNVIRISKFA